MGAWRHTGEGYDPEGSLGGEAPVQAKKRYHTKDTAWDFPGSITNCERFWGAYAPHALCNKA